MKKNIENYVFVKQNFLDKEFCQNTIEKLNQLNRWEKHDWTTYDPRQKQELVLTWSVFSFWHIYPRVPKRTIFHPLLRFTHAQRFNDRV